MFRPDKYRWRVYIGSWSLTHWLKFLAFSVAVILAVNYIGGGPHTSRVLSGTAELDKSDNSRNFTAPVIGISDGDTIKVLQDGVSKRIRLWGIDCPEMEQAFGTRAKQFTGDLAFGKTVTLHVYDVDHYGRQVAEIILPDGRNLNREIVRAGFAWWYRQYAKQDTELESLEAEARAAKRGLWADKDPMPPWDFRRDAKAEHQSERR